MICPICNDSRCKYWPDRKTCYTIYDNLRWGAPERKNVFHGHPEFYKILDELRDLHSRKNQDYAGDDPLSNLKMCEKGGLPGWKGVIVRLSDKMCRLLQFMSKGEFQVKDESIEDTFRDAAIYSILGLILYREGKENQNEKMVD